MDAEPQLRMYDELAPWFHLLTAPADYAEEAAFVAERLAAAVSGPLTTLLELGSGGGNLASHLRERFELTLVDRSPAMLEVSRSINPGVEHLVGDMRTIRLGRSFDAVVIHDAIVYMTSADDLRAALATAAAHLRPGGAAMFLPDHVRETFAPATEHGGHDAPDGRGLRYLEWTTDPDLSDTTYVSDFAFLLRDADGAVRLASDRHVQGLFGRDEWLALLSEVGFEAEAVDDRWERTAFVGRRPRHDR